MSMLQFTSASYSRISHWFLHVVDNFNIICKDRRVSHLRDFFTSSKSDIKPIDYVRNFILDKHFVM